MEKYGPWSAGRTALVDRHFLRSVSLRRTQYHLGNDIRNNGRELPDPARRGTSTFSFERPRPGGPNVRSAFNVTAGATYEYIPP
ncbi:hypothetical protein O9K51_07947 [Purpureocillium lavendulum]|uniref:Uncharacterized protein n=1 Tax=Purpureocillium lavendulum TaxID=1247861 RepID=A0AB34FMJ2_9HYPO|nr:hypothetical protein O9K51_07947 [Purpureocillium lavendulum]